MNEKGNTKKPRKSVKTFPLIQWVGFKGDMKALKKRINEKSTTRAIEKTIINFLTSN